MNYLKEQNQSNLLIYWDENKMIEVLRKAFPELGTSKPEIFIDNSGYYTRQELKDFLHISYPTINRLEKNGKIKGYRIGGRVLYKKDQIEGALTQIPSVKYKRAR